VFDNAGTLIGVTQRAGFLDKDGNLPRMKQALLADSFAAMFGSLIGTSTTTSYIESAAGVSAGGRTGLTAVFVALFFLLALFFSPLAEMVPAYASAAALLYVACVMTRALAEIDWEDITEYAPAVVTAVTMPLTYSIATGIGLGFITYVLAKLIAGKFAEAKPAVVILAIIFAVKFALPGIEPIEKGTPCDRGAAFPCFARHWQPCCSAFSAQPSGANCSELKIFGSRVTKMIVAELGPQFERASGYTPVVVADVAAVMKRRIESDEPFDLAVLVDFQTDELIKSRQSSSRRREPM
jgi:hypothetical protein